MDVLNCCFSGTEADDFDQKSCVTSASAFSNDILTADHLTSTPLFDAIQNGDWSGVDYFLDAGSFSFSPFTAEDDDDESTCTQAETWIVCSDEDGELKWRLLPLHAAICYGAPYHTVRDLVKMYPGALCCADVDGNLPIHLAVRFNRSDRVLRLLLNGFPEGLEARNGKRKLPLECADKCLDEASRQRYHKFQTFVDCTTYLALDRRNRELEVAQKATMKASAALSEAKKELLEERKGQPKGIVKPGSRSKRAWKKFARSVRAQTVYSIRTAL